MLSACTNSENKGLIISVLEDITETHLVAQPDAETITALYNFDTNLWQSATFRYGRINSLMHNSREVVTLKGQQVLLGNELERRQLVAGFNMDVSALLNKPKDSTTYQHSSIWLPLAEELKTLQKEDNSQITLYVFSDLRENTSWFSTYRTSDMKLLNNKSETIIELFLAKAKGLTSSENIKVVVVYQPQTITEDEMFQELRMLYTQLFLKLGIDITFIANLNVEAL
ncbi:MAG: hypothetical protein PSN34_11755 [Urechidicola sp.]|nr:hypothetical protein [Urechidicola sp.]